MGRALTPGGAPSPHHHHHHHQQPPHNFQNYPPPSSPPPESLYPPKGTTNNIQQQQQACNVIASPPPQYYQQNSIAPNPIAFPQQQQQKGNYGNAMNNNNNNIQSQPQPLMFHKNAAIGVPLQVASSSPQPQQVVNNSSEKMAMVMPWTTGLFDCMDDPNNAMMTALFPCITFGQIADVLDNGHTTCTTSAIIYAVVPCIVSRAYRKKLRQRYGLVEAPASDWIVHSMFELCAICQEYRELTNRGINPAIGYQGNLNNYQSQQNITMMPPNNQFMR